MIQETLRGGARVLVCKYIDSSKLAPGCALRVKIMTLFFTGKKHVQL